ncbi:MAG: right-handed parallel beta-helix repeat-containing protein [Verrucomicrobiota bacterium]|nr:right-handed parallel beta-helix repeat-containing protein [Verrucomicrobiota bacterium]
MALGMIGAVAPVSPASAATVYVSRTSASPSPPYAAWDTAAHDIQDAVEVANSGDTVLVAPGQYDLTNQVAITNAIVLRSSMGASQTFLNVALGDYGLWVSNSAAVIDGFTMQGPASGSDAAGVFLVGGTVQNCAFTNFWLIRQGASVCMTGGILSNSMVTYNRFDSGSGVYCSGGGLITGCQILGSATVGGSHATGVYLVDSQLTNSAIVGIRGAREMSDGPALYASNSIIEGCSITHHINELSGAGAYLDSCLMDRCLVAYNNCATDVSGDGGGGIFETNSIVRDSLIVSNACSEGVPEPIATYGGGVYMAGGALVNCTITGNSAQDCGPAFGAGIYVQSGGITNCILYSNYDTGCSNAEDEWFNAGPGIFDHCCTTPDPGGVGNITQDPQFVGLAAGVVQPWMAGAADLDGNPRTLNDTVDLGAYESQSSQTQSAAQSVAILGPRWRADGFAFSFLAQRNHAYSIQYTYSLAPARWQALTNFSGDGTMLNVTNQNLSISSCFYRVVAQ